MPTIGQEIYLFSEFDLAIRAVLEPCRFSESSELLLSCGTLAAGLADER
jgi:hypothetical protein